MVTNTFIWAHRGASGHEVDNTLESFKLAIEMGADGLESDVYLTRDNRAVFYHEDRINYNGKMVKPSELTLKEIQSIDLGKGRIVPTAESVLNYFKDKKTLAGNKILYSLDLKKISMGQKIIEVAERVGITSNIELTPNDNYPNFWSKVQEFKQQNSKIQITDSAHFNFLFVKKIFGKMYYQNWDKFKLFNLKAINIKAGLMTDEIIKNIHAHGLKVYVWDCHTEEGIRKFIGKEVDAIYSNYPDLAVKVRNEFIH
jgi:glycerophosphoryl diester phosphodiesterase